MYNYLEGFDEIEEAEIKKINEEALRNISGGKMNTKLIAKYLLGITFLSGVPANFIPNSSYAVDSSALVKSENSNEIKPILNFEKTAYFNQTFTKKQAIEDIDYVLKAINKYHIECAKGLPEKLINQKEIEIKNLPEEVTALELSHAISRILKHLNDAHTSISAPSFYNDRKCLPFYVESKDNEFFCISGKYKGAKILSIDGKTISELYSKFKSLQSYEIEEWPHTCFFSLPLNLISINLLTFLDIDTSKPLEIEFETENGVKLEKFEADNYLDVTSILKKEPFISYKIDKEKNVAILKLNVCIYDDVYKKTVDEFFYEVSQNNIKNIILDLRDNGGGNSMVRNYLESYFKNAVKLKFDSTDMRQGNTVKNIPPTEVDLSKEKAGKNMFDGNIYVATSNKTFSSAVLITTTFSDNNLCTVVGEIPGNSPAHCGYVLRFQAPNSKLRFRASCAKFYRDPSKDPKKFIPDIQVDAKDVINKIYEIIENQSKISNLK